MNPSSEVRTMLRRSIAATAVAVAIVATPATASAKDKLKLDFQKDCPEFTCSGTLIKRSGAAIPGTSIDTTLTPLWSAGGVLGYSAHETIAGGDSEFAMNLLGTLDTNAEPDVTHVIGSVVSGSWHGRPLTGALVQATAVRAFDTTFQGLLVIRPPE